MINYLRLVESGKQQINEVRRKFNRKTWKQKQFLSESGFFLHISLDSFLHIWILPPLYHDRRIKMNKKKKKKKKAGVVPKKI